MRNTRNQTRLSTSYRLFDESGANIVRKLTGAEVNYGLARGSYVWKRALDGTIVGVKMQISPQQSRKYSGIRTESRGSISKSQMEANAEVESQRRFGLNLQEVEDEMIVGNPVDEAKTKFEMWPQVFDTKAVCVGPRV